MIHSLQIKPLCQTYVSSKMSGYIQIPDQEHQDTLVVGMVGNGWKLPNFYIESRPARRRRGNNWKNYIWNEYRCYDWLINLNFHFK